MARRSPARGGGAPQDDQNETQSVSRSMETSHRSMTVLRCKVALVGDACVGKSALANMFYSGGHNFPKNYVMTKIVDFCVRSVRIPESTTSVELYLFDCAGQSIFNHDHTPEAMAHLSNCSMVMLVYDIANRESFQKCRTWLQKVRAARGGSSRVLGVVVANKMDLVEGAGADECVSTEEGRDFAKESGLKYFESSAKTGQGVDDPFNCLAEEFKNKYETYIKEVQQANV